MREIPWQKGPFWILHLWALVIASVDYILKASCLETHVSDFTNASEIMPQRLHVSYYEKVLKKTVKDVKIRGVVILFIPSFPMAIPEMFFSSLTSWPVSISQLAIVYIKESVPIWETLYQNLPYFDILKVSRKVIALSWVCFCLAPKSDRQLDSKNTTEARSIPSKAICSDLKP